MFRITFILAAILGICLPSHISAQEVECSVLIREASDELHHDGGIVLSMTRGNPDFTVYLYDKAPWKGGKQLLKIEHVITTTVSLDEIPPGEYYIIVEDKDRNPWAKAVAVGIKPE